MIEFGLLQVITEVCAADVCFFSTFWSAGASNKFQTGNVTNPPIPAPY
jgi:hypothetical protein